MPPPTLENPLTLRDQREKSAQITPFRAPDRSQVFVDAKKIRDGRNRWAAVVLSVIAAALYIIGNGNVAVPLVPILIVAFVIVLACNPDLFMPITLGCACLFETYGYNFADSITDRVPLFWNVNTAFQIYFHLNYHGLPLSVFELLLILTAVCATVKSVYDKTFTLKGGTFIVPILIYIVCVCYGLINGLATGGDFKMALFEIRAQIYMLIGYLLAVNNKVEPKEAARQFLRIATVCIGIKGILCTYRFFVTLHGHTVPEVGIGSHEESFFFDCYFMLYFVLKLGDLEPGTRKLMLLFMIPVFIANLANQRRAATAALGIALPLLLFLSAFAFPKRRVFIGTVTLAILVVAGIYLPLFWNNNGVLGQPARAIRSHFNPDARDLSSDVYRQQEDANLMFTMHSSPIIGYGYGKPIRNIAGMVDLTNIDPNIMFLTHDQILWVWMRVGTVGFFVFWIMICNFLIKAAQTAKHLIFDPFERLIGAYSAVVVVLLLIFGLLDLQLSNVRDILFSFILLGILAGIIGKRQAILDDVTTHKITTINGIRLDDPQIAQKLSRARTMSS